VIRDVLETAPTATTAAIAAEAFADNPALQAIVLLDDHFRPVSVLDADTAGFGLVSPRRRVNLDKSLSEALARSMTGRRQAGLHPCW
jgi:hypothetical protein